jgi:hypothetical protein
MVFLEQHNVPLFYGIPKIHKTPVKMRPIIPCHSAIQNPAAKYVSKKLKPIIQSAPAIIHGTKDLAQKLSKVSIDKSRRWYIITGDVVAFYPNIPIEHCLDVVSELYSEFYRGGRMPTDRDELREDEFFLRCLRLGNTNLVTRFQDMFYLQKRGLAMGVADSPDLANLYGWFFERKVGIMENINVPYYGRYIDDCFAIVYASSELEALLTVQCIEFDECTIEWNVGTASPFLDMMIFQDENNCLQYMPYRKSGSHQERIPWISHHPLDVKRGTFIGEMSRLATLSSQFEYYRDAMKTLAELYIVRGYPSDLVYKWLRENIAVRWNNRLNVIDRAPEGVLVLKTEYNTAWNFFNAKELGDTVLGFWNEWFNRASIGSYSIRYPMFSGNHADLKDVGYGLKTMIDVTDGRYEVPDVRKLEISQRRLIVSRKRTRNLFDLTSLWKKTVLQRYDRDVLSDDQLSDTHPNSSSESDRESDHDVLMGDIEYTAGPSDLYLGGV